MERQAMAGHRWVKIDTSYFRNPKITALTPPARLLHLASILWTADQLTDGQIPHRTLTELAQNADIHPRWVARTANQLVDHHLWVPTAAGWVIHDFEIMNPQAMRHRVEAQRQAWRARQADHRG